MCCADSQGGQDTVNDVYGEQRKVNLKLRSQYEHMVAENASLKSQGATMRETCADCARATGADSTQQK